MTKRSLPPKRGNRTKAVRLPRNISKRQQLDDALSLLEPNSPAAASLKARHARNMVDAFRQHTDKAIDTITNIMGDEDNAPRDRLLAAKTILERGYGKAPRTTIKVLVDDLEGEALRREAQRILLARQVEGREMPQIEQATQGAPHTPSSGQGAGGSETGAPKQKKKGSAGK